MSERPGSAVTREELLGTLLVYQNALFTRCVDHLIARLRIKVAAECRQPTYILTVHGDGHRLRPQN